MKPPAAPAAYVRVAVARSTTERAIMYQRDQVLAAAVNLGWPPPVIYADAGPAAGPQLTALTQAITEGQYDALIMTDPARISRDIATMQAFITLCQQHDTTVHLTNGELLDPHAALWAGITG